MSFQLPFGMTDIVLHIMVVAGHEISRLDRAFLCVPILKSFLPASSPAPFLSRLSTNKPLIMAQELHRNDWEKWKTQWASWEQLNQKMSEEEVAEFKRYLIQQSSLTQERQRQNEFETVQRQHKEEFDALKSQRQPEFDALHSHRKRAFENSEVERRKETTFSIT